MDSEERDKAVMPNVVSYVAFESVQARNERHIKRLWITNLVLIVLLFLSNAIAITAMTAVMTVHTHAGAAQMPSVTVWDGTARSVVILAVTAVTTKN